MGKNVASIIRGAVSTGGWALIAAAALGASACGTVIHVTRLGEPGPELPKRADDQVIVYSSELPNRPYTQWAFLEARQASTFSDDSTSVILAKMTRRAAELGCDGLILTGSADQVEDSALVLSGLRGTCILFRHDARTSQ